MLASIATIVVLPRNPQKNRNTAGDTARFVDAIFAIVPVKRKWRNDPENPHQTYGAMPLVLGNLRFGSD